jgi:hypothetical protein
MVILTQSLEHWLCTNHKELFVPIMFGHTELFTEEMQREYLEWCKTDEGKQYLEGGSKYNPEHRSVKRLKEMG